MNPKRVGFLIYPEIQALDLAGPMDTFAAARVCSGPAANAPGYELIRVGLSRRRVRAENGLQWVPECTIDAAAPLDTPIIPGGCGMREQKLASAVGDCILRLPHRPRRLVAVCTGVFGLAATGLLKGRRVTTHWRYARELATRFPSLKIDDEPLFLKDGPFYTSAGITAGIDLFLALIAEDYGPSVSLGVARELVVHVKRAGGQGQFSEPLQYQTRSADGFADLVSWNIANLQKDLSVKKLAARVHPGTRHFNRRFKVTMGCTENSLSLHVWRSAVAAW